MAAPLKGVDDVFISTNELSTSTQQAIYNAGNGEEICVA